MHPLANTRTPNAQLLASTTGIILIIVVAVAGLAVLIGLVYWAESHPGTGGQGTGRQRARPGPGDDSDGAEPMQISPGQGHRPWERPEDRHVPERGHPHGRPSSWAIVAVVLVAFIAGGVALIAHAWWLLWTCAGIVVLAIPVGKASGIMNDTISWGSTPAALNDELQGGDEPSAHAGDGPSHTDEPGRDRSHEARAGGPARSGGRGRPEGGEEYPARAGEAGFSGRGGRKR